jgi:hypothetical protein
MTFSQSKAGPNPPAGPGTGRLPPSVGDAIAGDTERYYYAPQFAQPPVNIDRAQSSAPPNTASLSKLKSLSRFMKGTFMFLLVAALLVTTGMAVFFSQEANHQRRRNWELEDRARARVGSEQANGRAQGAWEQMEEALQLSHEASERAAGAGATFMTGGDKPVDLEKYAYPEAQVEARTSSPGNEAFSLLTLQDLDTVEAFYERLLGKPVLQATVGDSRNRRRKLLFQSSTLPSILVKVEELEVERREKNQVKITILHSLIRFPRFNEARPAT